MQWVPLKSYRWAISLTVWLTALSRSPGRPATLVTYQDDPREDLGVLSSPSAVLIDGIRVR